MRLINHLDTKTELLFGTRPTDGKLHLLIILVATMFHTISAGYLGASPEKRQLICEFTRE